MINVNRPAGSRPRAGSAGFTLLEVLIAIVVVAFGLLGLAGLQTFALKNNHSASMRVTATALASDMVDRMKTNFLGVVEESKDNYNRTNLDDYKAANLVPSCNSDSGSTCSPENMAKNDRAEWQAKVAGALPGGIGIICVDSTPNDAAPTPTAHGCDNLGTTVFVVKIWWDDRASGATTGTLKYHWTAFNP